MISLAEVKDPSDIRALNREECEELADDIRAKIIQTVAQNGGHLSSNLGMVEATVALMRVSMAAALRAMPPKPQIPRIPTFSLSTKSRVDRKSTAAEKSSVLMSGEATFRASPPLSPMKEGSKARAAKPRLANSSAYRPEHCSFTAPKGPLTAMAGSLPCMAFGWYKSAASVIP